jgi:hypothetical protein
MIRASIVGLVCICIALAWYASGLHHELLEWRNQRAGANRRVKALIGKGISISDIDGYIVSGVTPSSDSLEFRFHQATSILPLDARLPRKVIRAAGVRYAGHLRPKDALSSARPNSGESSGVRARRALVAIMNAIHRKHDGAHLPLVYIPVDGSPVFGTIVTADGALTLVLATNQQDNAGYNVYYSYALMSGPNSSIDESRWPLEDGPEGIKGNLP